MSAGSILLLLPETFFVLGVVTCSLGGYLTDCFDVSHVTACLLIKNVLFFCYHWNWSCKFIWHLVAILCSCYCVSIRYVLAIAYQYVNFVDPNGTYEWSWRGVIMTAIPKPREDFTIFDVICDYTLNKINFMKTSGTY